MNKQPAPTMSIEDALRAENAEMKATIAEAKKSKLGLEAFFVAQCYETDIQQMESTLRTKLARKDAEINALEKVAESASSLNNLYAAIISKIIMAIEEAGLEIDTGQTILVCKERWDAYNQARAELDAVREAGNG